ncbi:hypothetical protein [Synechococcus sp. PROS-7-1]|uniref:hypothetical protein n=1 Tax=Synechococcus sp. PROS-7-1 TaxID=1442556 RepID=UPI0016456C76|nr:hypothetical protein [Synechococcus sp. PROS-7-1]
MKTLSPRREALASAATIGAEKSSTTHRPCGHQSTDRLPDRSSQLISWDDLLGQR